MDILQYHDDSTIDFSFQHQLFLLYSLSYHLLLPSDHIQQIIDTNASNIQPQQRINPDMSISSQPQHVMINNTSNIIIVTDAVNYVINARSV